MGFAFWRSREEKMKTRNSLLLITLLLLAGCDAFQDADPYPYEVLVQGTQSGITTPTEEIIDSKTEWEQFWQRHTSVQVPPPSLPQVDFASSVLVALYGGNRPSSGYSITIVAVTEKDSDVRIDYRIDGSGGPLTVETQPFAILRLQRPVGRISIRRLSDRF
jgi:hypothetical protein